MEMAAGVARAPLHSRAFSPQATLSCLLIPCLPVQDYKLALAVAAHVG